MTCALAKFTSDKTKAITSPSLAEVLAWANIPIYESDPAVDLRVLGRTDTAVNGP